MKINSINKIEDFGTNKKLIKSYDSLEQLVNALNKKKIPEIFLQRINQMIQEINSFSGEQMELVKLLKTTDKEVVILVEKEFGWVKKLHYQHQWTSYGIIAGVLFSTLLTQTGFTETWNSMALGISMGLIFGMLAGKNKDTQAEKDGLQLDI